MTRAYWTAEELVACQFPAPRWAIPGVLPEGLTLLAGAPKVGKSWLSIGIGVAVASGGRALGSTSVEAGDVLYLALEDTGRRLQSRLVKVLDGHPAPARLALTTFCEPLPAGGLERIDQWLTDHPSARLVIVDVLARVRGQAPANANAYDVDYNSLVSLKRVADQHRVAIVCVHHTRKAASEDFLDLVSGTQGLAGAADSVLVLKRDRGGHDAVLAITGRDIEEAEHPLKFDAETCTWHRLDGDADDYRLADGRRDVLHYLRRHATATPSEISRGLSIPEGTSKSTLSRMSKAGQLDTDGRGRYFLPATSATPATLTDPKGCTGCMGCTPQPSIA